MENLTLPKFNKFKKRKINLKNFDDMDDFLNYFKNNLQMDIKNVHNDMELRKTDLISLNLNHKFEISIVKNNDSLEQSFYAILDFNHNIFHDGFSKVKILKNIEVNESLQENFHIGDTRFYENYITKFTGTPMTISLFDYEFRSKLNNISKFLLDFALSNNGIIAKIDLKDINITVLDNVINTIFSISNLICSNNNFTNRIMENIQNETNQLTLIRMIEVLDKTKLSETQMHSLEGFLESQYLNVKIAVIPLFGEKGLDLAIKIIQKKERATNKQIEKLISVILKSLNEKFLNELIISYHDLNNIELKTYLISNLKGFDNLIILKHLRILSKKERNLEILSFIIDKLGSLGLKDDVILLNNIKSNNKSVLISNKCTKSIFRIQSRIINKDPGMLSITEINNDEGNLSLAVKEGMLSIKKI